jgi:hypothetical protein
MVRTIVLTALLLAVATAAAPAQIPAQPPPVASPLQGTEQERAACHPDVVRFCRDLVKDDANSDVFAILSCLQTNRNRLSRACGEVLVSHGQ